MVNERIPDALLVQKDRIRKGRAFAEHLVRADGTPSSASLRDAAEALQDVVSSCPSYRESWDDLIRSGLANSAMRNPASYWVLAQTRTRSSDPKPVAPMVEDAPGCALKPDPADAATMQELLERLRALWEWSGRPSTRRIAAGSGSAFSHTTANALLRGTGKMPPLSLDYVRGLVMGLGGSPDEVARWVTAWREIAMAPPARRLTVVND